MAAAAQDEPDQDLDNLLAQYEQQAEADKSRVTDTAAKLKPTSQMGMKELRETGLAQPISSDTKCGINYPSILQQASLFMLARRTQAIADVLAKSSLQLLKVLVRPCILR